MSDLKPCPFCGEAPQREPWPDGNDRPEIRCVNLQGCDVRPMTDGPCMADAEESWNRRASSSVAPSIDPRANEKALLAAMAVHVSIYAANGAGNPWETLSERDMALERDAMTAALLAYAAWPESVVEAPSTEQTLPDDVVAEVARVARAVLATGRWTPLLLTIEQATRILPAETDALLSGNQSFGGSVERRKDGEE